MGRSWFDLVVLGVVVVGALRGRKRGMSQELLLVLQWLSIVLVCANVHRPLGLLLSQVSSVKPLYGYVGVYVVCACCLKWVFTGLKNLLGDKLLTADAFGRSEYTLGMLGGMVRFTSALIVGLALLNAIPVSEADKAAAAKIQMENPNLPVPSLGAIQDDVFRHSLTGPYITRYVGNLLIQPAASQAGPAKDNIGKKRQRAVDEVIDK